jgi:hypothetical protein
MEFVEELTQEQRAQLVQLYAIERQDNQTSAIIAFAIVAAALTYIVASSAFFFSHCNKITCTGIPSWVQPISPLVPLALLSFLLLNLAGTLMRGKHLRKLEELLAIKTNDGIALPSFHRDSSEIYELKGRRSLLQVIYVPLTLTTYIPTYLIAIGFTIAVLIPGAWTWDKQLAIGVYSLILAWQVGGVLLPLFHSRFKRKFVSNSN